MVFEEKTLDSQMIYKGSIINLRKDRVTVQHGTSYREIIEHKGGAVIAAIDEDNNLVTVKQFRKPVERVMLELPAGKIDSGEDPLDTAKRELKEETGITARNIKHLTDIYPSVGYSQERLSLYLATGLSYGRTCPDENEALDIEKYPIEQLVSKIFQGQIQDAKSVVGILMVMRLLELGELE